MNSVSDTKMRDAYYILRRRTACHAVSYTRRDRPLYFAIFPSLSLSLSWHPREFRRKLPSTRPEARNSYAAGNFCPDDILYCSPIPRYRHVFEGLCGCRFAVQVNGNLDGGNEESLVDRSQSFSLSN